MPPPLYAKEAADVKTAKDCKDGFDNHASSYENRDPKTSEAQLCSLSNLTKEEALLRESENGKCINNAVRFFKLNSPNRNDIDTSIDEYEDNAADSRVHNLL